MRTRMMAEDHAQRFRDGRELFDSGQVTITDGDGTLRTANGPGWRISDGPINRQSLTEARTAYLDDLKNAWRKPEGLPIRHRTKATRTSAAYGKNPTRMTTTTRSIASDRSPFGSRRSHRR